MSTEKYTGSDAEFAGHIRNSGGLIYLGATNNSSISLSLSNSIDIVNLVGNLSITSDNILLDANLVTSTSLIKYTSDLSLTFDDLTLITKGYLIDYVDINSANALSDLTDVQISTGEPAANDFLYYDINISKWRPVELPESIVVSASKNNISTDIYLSNNEVPMSISPFILPANSYLKYISASCKTPGTWTAEVHVNNLLVSGAYLNIISNTKAYIKFTNPILFNAGDEVQLYCMGMNIDKPKISAYFITVPI